MPEGLLQLAAEIRSGQGRKGAVAQVSGPENRDSYLSAQYLAALQRVGKNDYTRKESRLLAEPLLAPLRSRRFWPGFQQFPLLANHSLVICGRHGAAPGAAVPKLKHFCSRDTWRAASAHTRPALLLALPSRIAAPGS